jgi:hypothetical protein
VLERLSYDAWGKRRFANGADDPSGSIASEARENFLCPNMPLLLLLQKFPVTANRDKCRGRPILRLTPPQIFIPNGRNGKFPCIFPCYQGISRGDWFATDWVVSQPVWSPYGIIWVLATETRFDCTETGLIAEISSVLERDL